MVKSGVPLSKLPEVLIPTIPENDTTLQELVQSISATVSNGSVTLGATSSVPTGSWPSEQLASLVYGLQQQQNTSLTAGQSTPSSTTFASSTWTQPVVAAAVTSTTSYVESRSLHLFCHLYFMKQPIMH